VLNFAGDLQALLHTAGKNGGQVINARRRDLTSCSHCPAVERMLP
jgi:hypothetical protein